MFFVFITCGSPLATAVRRQTEVKDAVQELDQGSALPPRFEGLLAGGQLWTAFTLSSRYNQNNAGAGVSAGDLGEVYSPFLPSGLQKKGPPPFSPLPEWSSAPRFLRKHGGRHASVHLWEGQGVGGAGVIYVTFTPADDRYYHIYHLRKIWAETKRCWSEVDGLNMSSYVKKKINSLWNGGLNNSLKEYATGVYKGHTFVFAGVSHGAALSQIASYRFAKDVKAWATKDEIKAPEILTVAFNSYLWTDKVGAAIVRQALGNHFLNVVLTQRQQGSGKRYWDAIPCYGFGVEFVNFPKTYLLEAGCNRNEAAQFPGDEALCGDFFAFDEIEGCPASSSVWNKNFWDRVLSLHKAPKIHAALKRATQKARKRAGVHD